MNNYYIVNVLWWVARVQYLPISTRILIHLAGARQGQQAENLPRVSTKYTDVPNITKIFKNLLHFKQKTILGGNLGGVNHSLEYK